jgi:hypothetical protein
MRRSTPILVVLLGTSLLANALLVARLSRPSDPRPGGAYRPPGADRASGVESVASLRESLDAEKKKNDELRARIERLESDKKILVQDAAPAGGKSEKVAAFREKLRKLMKVMKDPTAKAGGGDPDAMLEATETYVEFMKLSATRGKDPKTYADYLSAFYEVALEGDANAMTPAQGAALSKLFEDFGIALSKLPPTPAGERLLKEVELEAGVMSRVHDVLSAAQRELLTKDNMNMLATGNMISLQAVSKQGGAERIAQTWTAAYQLDPSQLPQAKVAAQAYLDAMSRADSEGKASSPYYQLGSPESYQYRLSSLREQLAALNMLSASMTAAQQERLRTQALREFVIFGGNAAGAPPPLEK